MVMRSYFSTAIVEGFVLGISHPVLAYDSYCSSASYELASAADSLDSALSQYASAKSSFESACDPSWGYSKSDESACGAYGYERMSLESAREQVRSAKLDLENSFSQVQDSCDTGGGASVARACISALHKAKAELGKGEAKVKTKSTPKQ